VTVLDKEEERVNDVVNDKVRKNDHEVREDDDEARVNGEE
jgi:hypothetical protein